MAESERRLSEIDQILQRFEDNWREGRPPDIDEFLASYPEPHDELLAELIHIDLAYRLKAGEPARVEDYLDRYASLKNSHRTVDLIAAELAWRRDRELALVVDDEIANRFSELQKQLRERLAESRARTGSTQAAHVEGTPTGTSSDRENLEVDQTHFPVPQRIGKYTIRRLLGQGGFGSVYLAQDEMLERTVAIKVPKRELFRTSADVDNFVREARHAAALRHAGIVTIYDVEVTDDGACFIVMEYLEGGSLRNCMRDRSFSPAESAELIAKTAEAVHHAHSQGFVHCDLKPENILLDSTALPHIVDFGLAVHDREPLDAAGGPRGTPSYMSPEQASGRSGQLDGRTDVYSLGVVLYELLTGRRPFVGGRQQLLIDQILNCEPRPPRQLNHAIPPGLEEVCLKALNKSAGDRYTTAKDFADDLRAASRDSWVGQESSGLQAPARRRPKIDAQLSVAGRGCQLSIMMFTLVFAVVGYFAWDSASLYNVLPIAKVPPRSSEHEIAAAQRAFDVGEWERALEKCRGLLETHPAEAESNRRRFLMELLAMARRSLDAPAANAEKLCDTILAEFETAPGRNEDIAAQARLCLARAAAREGDWDKVTEHLALLDGLNDRLSTSDQQIKFALVALQTVNGIPRELYTAAASRELIRIGADVPNSTGEWEKRELERWADRLRHRSSAPGTDAIVQDEQGPSNATPVNEADGLNPSGLALEAMNNSAEERMELLREKMRQRLEQFQNQRQLNRDSETETVSSSRSVRRLPTTELDPKTGQLTWPAALRTEELSAERERIDQLFAKRAEAGFLDPNGYVALHKLVDRMGTRVRERSGEFSTRDLIAARKFLESLALEATLAARSNSP